MARARIIKPDFFRSRSICKLSHSAQLTFIGLWCEADSEGRGIAHPAILKGSIWPLDDTVTSEVVERHLCELHETGHIVLYMVGEDRFYEVPSWEKHQSAAYRTGESKYPPSSGETSEIVQLANGVVQPAQQTLLKGNRREEKRMASGTADAVPADFAAFWLAYPRKTAKPEALKAWNRAKPDLDVVLAAIKAQAPGWTDPKFIPHPATWLNGHRWEDEVPVGGRDTYRQVVEW